ISENFRRYGYDEANSTFSSVDYTSTFPQYSFPASRQQVPNPDTRSELFDRFVSFYASGSYTYADTYTLSGSVRKDQSNLFGVRANQRGVPLWSAGLAWMIDRESFYPFDFLPVLKLRASFGYNGNIDRSLSALTTASYFPSSQSILNVPSARIINSPNPGLSWERSQMLNLGLDFGSRASRITGSLDVFFKKGINLIGLQPYAPSTGITLFRGNTANTRGRGFDVMLNSINTKGRVNWSTSLMASYARDVVSRYFVESPSGNLVAEGQFGTSPFVGKPLYALYSYPWRGLNPETGDPAGLINGERSEDYAAIVSSTPASELVYSGPTRPQVFGALRNTVSYRNFSASLNIAYRLGYFYRARGIFYTNVLMGQGYPYGQYADRWQKPGDESRTQVPGLPAGQDFARDQFYNYSEILAKRADNIRLQDATLSYALPVSPLKKWGISGCELYLYANNLGILWKATPGRIDPDYVIDDFPPTRTLAAGLKLNF
ncbi:MAG: TonB-dependent receptor, partial [Mucilaginibacter polytrichastri]|nr:TonB-dependent receptor [Mucilaginibacter polytrichastri]